MIVKANEQGFSIEIGGEEYLNCPAAIAVDADGRIDADERFLPMRAFDMRREDGKAIYTWRTQSDLWAMKTYTLEAGENWARFFVRVEGEHSVDALRFFDGGARYETAGYLLPVAGHADEARCLRMMTEPGVIELGYFTPPCYCYPLFLDGGDRWLGVGLAARAGQYNFHQFMIKTANNRCGFEVPLYGKTRVSGEWESQSLLFTEGKDAFDVLRAYAAWHYESGWCVKKDRSNEPDWWKRPIYCGWGEQCDMAHRLGGKPFDYATQRDYEAMSRRLDALDLHPGCLIIDDKWQGQYGEALPDPEKWPDLRAFADAEHKKGRRVVLWFRSWYPEGLRAEECAEYLCTACGADPTSEKYRARMKETIRRLLSDEAGCYNCDGFKIDFANCMPLGKYVQTHEEGVCGVELLRRFMTMMRDFARAVKPDALINCSCAHPYFDEIVDQARLHDYDGQQRSALQVLGYRAKLYAAALPDVIIDTDAGGIGTRREFERWVKGCAALGVPDLYYLSGSGGVRLTDEDADLIRACWADYEKARGGTAR